MSKGPRIGWMIDNFLGDDVLKAVRDTWPVVMLRRSDEAGGLKDLRALLLLVEQPRFEGIATIARVRELSPSLPIIALSRGLDVNHAVDLLRLGVADCMEHPWEPTVILRKIDRAMSGAASMSFTSPLLTPFAQRAGRPDHGVNRRRCFRAPIHASHGVASRIQFADLDRVCALTELGVPSEGGTGGFTLHLQTTQGDTSFLPPYVGESVIVALDVLGHRMSLTGIVRRITPVRTHPPMTAIGVEYVAAENDEMALQHLWIEAQRTHRLQNGLTRRGSMMSTMVRTPGRT